MLGLDRSLAYIHEPFNPTYERTRLPAPMPTAFTFIDNENASQYRPGVEGLISFRWPAQLKKVLRTPKAGARLTAEVWADQRRHRRPLIKDPLALMAAPWLTEAFGMQTVVMVRHPAGFVSSILRLGWNFNFNDFLNQPALLAGPLASTADLIRTLVSEPPPLLDQAAYLWRILNGFVSEVESSSQWQVYRHEDLAADPIGEFNALYTRLGLAFTEAVREQIASANSDRNAAEVSAKDIRRSSTAQATSWRKRLDEAAVARIRTLTEEVASRWYSEADWRVSDDR